MLKGLFIVVGVGVGLIVLLGFTFSVLMGVGHLNFAVNKAGLHRMAVQAHTLEVAPGQRVMVQMSGGRLVKAEFSDMAVRRDAEGRLSMWINRGGGHLGSQGYIYSADPSFDVPNGPGTPSAESNAYTRVARHWWSYDSVED